MNRRKRIRSLPKKISEIPIYKLIPSFVTIFALCLGISAVRYALDEKWTIAAGLIIFAGFMDGIDGRLARMLNSTSGFGAQLDSLADLVSFGVAPAIVTYLWILHEIPYKGVGWAVVLFFIICAAVRLARFNSKLEDTIEKEKLKKYFTGVPMPSAGALLILPLTLTFELVDIKFSYWFIAVYQVAIGLLMISKVPTFSFKNLVVRREYISLLFIAVACVISAIVIEPWIFLPIIALIYIAMIPISVASYYRNI